MIKVEWRRFKELAVLPAALAAFSMIAGCMNASKMAVDTAKSKTAQLSSQILELSGLHGKVTESGPLINTSGSQPNEYYVRHAWAIYGLPNSVLETGMNNLHEALPQHGWKIVSYGPAHSAAGQLQIKAEHAQDHYTVVIEWLKGKYPGDAPTAPDTAEIGVTLASPTYEDPDGVGTN